MGCALGCIRRGRRIGVETSDTDAMMKSQSGIDIAERGWKDRSLPKRRRVPRMPQVSRTA